MAYAWTTGKHTLHLGGEFQHYTAYGEINVFGTGTVILASDFGFADLNGDGPVNDLDIPIAVALKSSAPVTGADSDRLRQLRGRLRPGRLARNTRLTLNLGLRWEYDSESHRQFQRARSLPEPDPAAHAAMHMDGERHRSQEDIRIRRTRPARGFHLNPFGKGKTVLRGGYGIYYDRIILESGAEELVQNDRALTVTQYAGSLLQLAFVPASPSLDACFAPGASFAPGTPDAGQSIQRPHQVGGVGILAWGRMRIIRCSSSSRWAAAAVRSNWLISRDGLHVFADRQIIGHLLRSTGSTSPYISCPGNNIPCTITDPLTGISDNITLINRRQSPGTTAHREHGASAGKAGKIGYQYNVGYTLSKTFDYSDDDQLTNSNADEQVDLVKASTICAWKRATR